VLVAAESLSTDSTDSGNVPAALALLKSGGGRDHRATALTLLTEAVRAVAISGNRGQ
jgi:hypothetical protein